MSLRTLREKEPCSILATSHLTQLHCLHFLRSERQVWQACRNALHFLRCVHCIRQAVFSLRQILPESLRTCMRRTQRQRGNRALLLTTVIKPTTLNDKHTVCITASNSEQF